MASSKLNYASLRSVQRKNRSMHEVKDLLPKNPYLNPGLHANQSPPFSLEQTTQLSKDYKIKDNFTSKLYDELASTDNSSFPKSSFNRYKEEATRYENKPIKGHHRVKSSITEMYQRNQERSNADEGPIGGKTFGEYEASTNRELEALYRNHEREDLIEKLEEKQRARDAEKAALMREGRTLSDFLNKNGGFAKGTKSPEETRPRKRENSANADYTRNSTDKKREDKLLAERSPTNEIFEDVRSPKGDFLTKLNDYIEYFKRSERTHRKASKEGSYDYAAEEKGRGHYEDGSLNGDMRIIKKHVEDLDAKVEEVLKSNKKLIKEFSSMRLREEEYTQRLGGLEDEFMNLKKRNYKYKEKLKATTQLLQQERIDNQNNLLALKKVLSNGVNMVLESKGHRHMDGHREKQSRYEYDGSRNAHLETSHKKREREENREGWKKQKSSEKKQRNNDSIFTQKGLMFSNEDPVYLDKGTDREEVEEENTEEGKLDTYDYNEEDLYNRQEEQQELDDYSKRQEVWSPTQYKASKESMKERQIRVLQKLAGLMEGQDSKYGHHHDKLIKQVWPSNIDTRLLNTMKQLKQQYPTKHSVDMDLETYGHMPPGKDRKGSYPKVNSFFTRDEVAFE